MLPIFKSQLFLYRLGLGWMLGRRFMLLTHIGRRSGRVRRTILAVLRFDPQTKEIMAISAWSASDWYLNIQASPALEVETGRTRYVPQQRTLTPEEIATLFDAFRDKHPAFSRIVCQIPGWKWNSSLEEFLELARTLRSGAFRPIS
ncbi:MAG TPA: nitroreductase family deazaflavin-dependent oxidoreductase [Anaerolineales bacterium]|nr:nitroreductase family deazaflavin-dependent oxidoreductase [Anaerolineales bacterium]